MLSAEQTTKQYEDETKRRFIQEPANLKLLIVVSKLLTGFDAPSCTYIYLDNELRDHNLFQAICRTNRLDGDDKDYGHIVDFKELFGDVQQAIAVYSSDELDIDEGSDTSPDDNNVKLKDWLVEGKAKLDDARQALHYLCEPVPTPREVEQFLRMPTRSSCARLRNWYTSLRQSNPKPRCQQSLMAIKRQWSCSTTWTRYLRQRSGTRLTRSTGQPSPLSSISRFGSKRLRGGRVTLRRRRRC